MKFSFISIFPSMIESYFSESIIKKAIDKNLLEVELIDLKQHSTNRYHKLDRPKIGGGAGMLMEAEPILNAIQKLKTPNTKVIFPLPAAKPFKNNDAKRLAAYDHIIFVSSRYEGVDERAVELCADEVFSIGDFILSGGEIASLAMFDATIRFLPGVLGNEDSLSEESFENTLLEAPSFTKPLNFNGMRINSEFSKGNHAKISSLKKEMSIAKTRFHRPDLFKKYNTVK